MHFFGPLKHVTLDHVDLAAHAQEMWLFSSVAAMIGSVAQGGLYDFDRVDGTGWFCQFVLKANPLKQQLVVWDTFPTLSLSQATTVQPMPSWTLSVHDDVPSNCQPSPCNGGLGLKLVWLHVPEHRKAGSHMGWEAAKREVASYDSNVFVSIEIFFDTAFSDLFKVNSPISWFDSSKVRKGRFFGKIL